MNFKKIGILLAGIAVMVSVSFGEVRGLPRSASEMAANEIVPGEVPPGALKAPKNTSAFQYLRSSDQSQVKAKPLSGQRSKAPASFASAMSPRILGSVVSAAVDMPAGLYKLPYTSTENFETVIDGPFSIGGGVQVGSIYYSTYYFTFFGYYYVVVEAYDMETGELLSSRYASSFTALATDIALDPVSNKIYGCYYREDGDGFNLAIGDPVNMISTPVCALDDAWHACAIDSNGQLYAVDYEAHLLKVDKNTGNSTVVGTLPFTPAYAGSAAFDLTDNTLYLTTILPGGQAGLYKIDTATAAADLVTSFAGSQQVCGLIVPEPLAKDNAPAAVSNLEFLFDKDNLNGQVVFTSPSTNYNGSSASGTLSYTVEADGKVIASGTTSYGAKTTANVTLPSPASYKFAVYVSNSEGHGVKSFERRYIGHDTPVAPKVSASFNVDTFNVTWDKVTGSVNGGYVDPAAITYTVKRFPDNVVVASGISTTSLADKVTVPESLVAFNYEVTATYRDKTSAPGRSNEITIGVVVPPYAESFDTQAAFNTYSVVDANHDDITWYWWSTRKRAHIFNSGRIGLDDWLFTPPLKLKGGMAYPVNFDTYSSGDYVEKLEVRFGKSNDPSSMTTIVMPVFNVTQKDAVPYSCYIEPSEDGIYYIGFHALSPYDTDYVDVDDIQVGEGINTHAPEAVSGLSVIPDETGVKSCAISFVAPTKDYSGETITSLQSVQVYRNGEMVHSARFPNPGETVKYTDLPETPGYYTYTIYAVNASGRGKPLSSKVFVGTNRTEAPRNVSITENGDTGNVTVKWDAPQYDVDGRTARLTYVTYSIHDGDQTIVSGLTEKEYSFRAYQGDGQKYVEYAVVADTESGPSANAMTAMIPVGKPYAAPFKESFEGGKSASIYASQSMTGLNPSVWKPCVDNEVSNLSSQDGDNGYLAFSTDNGGGSAWVATGKIKLTGLDNPGLVFYSNPLTNGNLNTNTIDVYVNSGTGFKKMRTVTMTDLLNEGWNKIVVPLSDYAGKTVTVRFEGANTFNLYTVIDNITVDNIAPVNLTAYSVSAPATVKPGELFDVSPTIQNNGSKASGSFVVNLLCNGVEVSSKDRGSMQPGSSVTLHFYQELDVLSPEDLEYRVQIVSDGDTDQSDNLSAIVPVRLVLPAYPAVDDLQAEQTSAGVKLDWNEPEMSFEIPDPETDDFESYASWATSNVGDWTFVDGDGDKIGALQNISLPGITGTQSFWVMDRTLPALVDNDSFDAASGVKYLANMYTGKKVDDWAITPRLSGKAQTITFKARSYHEDYLETFQVLYSLTGTATNSFTPIATYNNVPNEWTEYSVEVPEGARYFAIRCVSDDAFMFFIDDVRFARASASDGLVLQGYNVYDNSKRIKTTDATSHEYAAAEGDHEYVVTVVYDKGESRPSNVVTLNVAGVDGVTRNNVTIKCNGLSLVISGAEGLPAEICSDKGFVILNTANVKSDIYTVELPDSGIYIIKVGNKQAKIVVQQ